MAIRGEYDPTTKQTATIELLRKCPSVAGIVPWNNRYYLNLDGFDRTFHGDRTNKFWIDTHGRLVRELGKGTCSYPFRDSRDSIIEFAISNGINIIEKR